MRQPSLLIAARPGFFLPGFCNEKAATETRRGFLL
jgi:hypothetical protein